MAPKANDGIGKMSARVGAALNQAADCLPIPTGIKNIPDDSAPRCEKHGLVMVESQEPL